MRSLIFLSLLFLGTVCVSPFLGPAAGEAWNWIFWEIRVPRTLCALLAGGALACAGLTFQAVFRNPLATPFTLGTASGAALGTAILIFFVPGAVIPISFFPFSPLVLAAFTGALVSLGLIFAVVQFSRRTNGTEILLAGVAVSFLFSSLIMLLQYLSDPTRTVRMLHWTMGGLESGGGYTPVLTLLLWVVPTLGILVWKHRELDLFCMGNELAHARGVETSKTRVLLLVTVSLLVAAVVSICGPIGFIGLMVPHIARHLVGARHSVLFPTVFLGGAILLMVCDTLARTVIFPDEIPVGILTALLGGPFFLALILLRTNSE